jgi:polysaccharide pyruvyl transferase WcaK-like protein
MKNHNPKIVLSNTYGHLNVGDEAILSSMISTISSSIRNVRITVVSRRPKITQKNHPHVQVIHSGVIKDGLKKTVRAIKNADLLIAGGGRGIQDSTNLGNLLFHLSRPLVAYFCGIPFICYALGVGPLRNKIDRFTGPLIFNNAVYITA